MENFSHEQDFTLFDQVIFNFKKEIEIDLVTIKETTRKFQYPVAVYKFENFDEYYLEFMNDSMSLITGNLQELVKNQNLKDYQKEIYFLEFVRECFYKRKEISFFCYFPFTLIKKKIWVRLTVFPISDVYLIVVCQ